MNRRTFSMIALVGVLAVAVAGGSIATASQQGAGAEAVAAKKKKKKKKKKKGATTVTAQFETPPAPEVDFNFINGLLGGAKFCGLLRTVQAVRVDTGAVLATSETDDTNVSYDPLLIQPRLAPGTQVKVVALENRSCRRGESPVISAP